MSKQNNKFELTEDIILRVKKHVALKEIHKNSSSMYSEGKCTTEQFQEVEELFAREGNITDIASIPEVREFANWYLNDALSRFTTKPNKNATWICDITENKLNSFEKTEA